MDKGKEKRRRTDKGTEVNGTKKKLRAELEKKEEEEEEEEGEETAVAATDEEVDEFFAILRRIKAAVKYFEKENREGWRAAVEAEVVALVDGRTENEADDKNDSIIKRGTKDVEEDMGRVLDLNAIPEAENNDAQTVGAARGFDLEGLDPQRRRV